MSDFVSFTILGLVTASVYAVAASGLVVTYTTSGIFNFAHGAIGMMGAFMYWQLLDWGVPTVPAIALVLVVFAPAFGALIDRVIMRGLEGTSEVTKTVVTVGLLFGLIALAPIIWPPTRNRVVGEFFGGSKFQLGDVFVSYHQVVVILVAGLVAVGLRLLLYGTRTGIAMRAVVSNRDLVRLNGGRPGRSSAASWALGSALAALSGILIADRLGLEVMALTLLVVNAYAAAIVGRLVSLPMTFLGAAILGLAQSYAVGYLPQNPDWLPDGIDLVTSLRLAIPVVMLFIVLLVLPQAPLRAHGIVRSREIVARPTMRSALVAAAVLVIGVGVVSSFLDASQTISWSKGLALAIIMLSLVPLTGYGGQISLAQMSFAGLGAYAMATWGPGGNPIGLLAAFALPALVGALVALPAVRLRGIYLALATLAFAVFMDRVVFTQDAMFRGGSKAIARLSFLGFGFESDRAYMILMAFVFAGLGVGVVWLRLGPFGRRLQAMKDSPAACATLGLNLTVTKLQVFMLSAGIAGIGGAMLGGLQKTATVSQYDTLQSLPVLLMAVAGGIGMVSGALLGGLLYASFPIIAGAIPSLANFLLVAPGLIGISLGRNPNGLMNEILVGTEALRHRLRAGRAEPAAAPEEPRRPLWPIGPVMDVEMLGIDRPFTAADLAQIDLMLGVDEEELAHGAPRG
ncbi:branched-chain amino acid ABC transporter permease [Rhabdothermincola sp.]|uniref:branched-chain amino acid ABC transporter permease n=1 Tax=Rhabdothermincola sp. TaxID=2820405 RepID=UPI002FE28EE6